MLKRVLKLSLVAVFVLGIASVSTAEIVKITHSTDGGSACTDGVCINDEALTSAQVTGWIPIREYRAITFGIKLTDANNSVTAVTMDCETSNLNSTTTNAGYDVCVAVSTSLAGTSTIVCPHLWSIANAYADYFNLTVDNLNADYIQCSFAGTGTPAAADTIHVRMLKKSP
jgi:hypothetical protein